MGDDDTTLSDDEIEALLEDDELSEEDEETSTETTDTGGVTTAPDQDAIHDQYDEINDSVRNVLETILTVDASQSIKSCGLISSGDLRQEFQNFDEDLVVVESDLSGDIAGVTRYAIPESDALILADVMMGQEGEDPPDELDDAYKSALGEMYNQILNTMFNRVNELTGQNLQSSAPEISVLESNDLAESLTEEDYLRVSYDVTVGDLIDGSLFYEVQPAQLGEILESAVETEEEAPEQEPSAEPEPEPESAPGQAASGQAESTEDRDQAEVKDVQFPQFDATEAEAGEGNLNMLMDVPMQVAVELGRTKLQVKEILNLGQGSIIELDRLAGEPVDLLVNGRLVARGEVVVIDESFGVRVTSIVSPMERIKQ